jgi:hypothetical protein
MDHVKRSDAPDFMAPGRKVSLIIGKNAILGSDDALCGFATFAPKYGTMESHYHENEYMYVISAKDAVVRYGKTKDSMTNCDELEAGDIIRPVDGEWHRFDFTSDEGYVEFLNFFATTQMHVVNESDVE